jgi:hypothetical protein
MTGDLDAFWKHASSLWALQCVGKKHLEDMQEDIYPRKTARHILAHDSSHGEMSEFVHRFE